MGLLHPESQDCSNKLSKSDAAGLIGSDRSYFWQENEPAAGGEGIPVPVAERTAVSNSSSHQGTLVSRRRSASPSFIYYYFRRRFLKYIPWTGHIAELLGI